MNRKLTAAFAVAGLAFAVQATAQVAFYENEGFAGRSFTTHQRIDDFGSYGFSNRASSVVVVRDRWEACEDTRYEGRCVVLRPGRYPSLAAMGLNNRVSSVRVLRANARISEDRYAPMPAAPQITFYEGEHFSGRSFTSARQVTNLRRSGLDDRASSAEVVGDRWEACDRNAFRGNCMVLRPGRYPSLAAMGLNDRVRSARAIAWDAEVADNRFAPVLAPEAVARRDYRRRNQERVYQANVTSVRAVVGPPEQRCWIEREQVPQQQQQQSGMSVPGAIAGAIIGGILGHQVGGGSGKDIATAGGAIAGGVAGANIGRITGNQPQAQAQAQMQDVQRCENTPSLTPTYWDVTYNFRGQDHRVQMTTQPGATITVNEQGEPRV